MIPSEITISGVDSYATVYHEDTKTLIVDDYCVVDTGELGGITIQCGVGCVIVTAKNNKIICEDGFCNITCQDCNVISGGEYMHIVAYSNNKIEIGNYGMVDTSCQNDIILGDGCAVRTSYECTIKGGNNCVFVGRHDAKRTSNVMLKKGITYNTGEYESKDLMVNVKEYVCNIPESDKVIGLEVLLSLPEYATMSEINNFGI